MRIAVFDKASALVMERKALQGELAELRRLRGLAQEGGTIMLMVMSERHTNETRISLRLPAAPVHVFLAAEIRRRGEEIDAELRRLGVEIGEPDTSASEPPDRPPMRRTKHRAPLL